MKNTLAFDWKLLVLVGRLSILTGFCPVSCCIISPVHAFQADMCVCMYSRGHKNLSKFTLLYWVASRKYYVYTLRARARELLLKIMAVLAKVGTLHEHLPSVLVDPCLYYCCTAHQAFILCVQRAVQEPFDRRAWVYTMLYVNLYGPQLLYSARKFGQVFLTPTVHVRTYTVHNTYTDYVRTYMYIYV